MMRRPRSRTVQEGREDLRGRLLAALDEPSSSGVLVLGEAGIGKTNLAEEILQRLAPETRVLRISGSAVLTSVPYGAFAAYLSGLPLQDAVHPVSVMRRVVHALGGVQQSGSELPLLVADDAHHLDAGSMALIAQLVAGRRVRVLLLARPTPGLPQGLEELIADGLLATATVDPLTRSEIEAACTAFLGGPVVAAVTYIAEDVTRGNPMFLRLFLRDAIARDFISEHDGVWQVGRELPEPGVHLTDLVHAELALLGTVQRDAMEILAVGEPLPEEQARHLIDRRVLRRLLDESWIRAGEDGSLVLDHPLYGESLRASIPTARRVLLQRRILALATARPRDVTEILRRTSLALDAGVTLDDDILLAAATVANRLHDGRFAMRSIRAIRAHELRGRCLVEAAWVRANDGDFDEALDLVDEALAESATPDVAREGTFLALEVRMRRGEAGDGMRRDIERWNLLLDKHAGSSGSDRSGITVGRNLISLVSDEGTFDAAAVRAVADHEDALPPTEMAALLALASFLLGVGRPGEALVLVRRALALITTGADTLTYRDHAVGLELLALIISGEWERARDVLRAHHRLDSRSIHFFAAWLDLIEGAYAIRQGRFRAACSRLHLAAEGLRDRDHLHILPWVYGLAAYTALLAGDRRRATLLVERITSTAPSGSRVARLLGEIYATSVTAVLDADPDGSAKLVLLADRGDQAGLPLAAAVALEQALVLKDPGVFGRLAALMSSFDGREHEFLRSFAQAGEAADPEELLRVGESAQSAGHGFLATRCFQRALELYEEGGDQAAARRARKKLAAANAGLEGADSSETIRLPAAARLTSRESAVVTLALEGLTNKEIAERQGVSVRTVEGHLYRIFTKFGISRREDLRLFAQET
jgi:DNA-binding CsgD family transcriptional regulator